MLRGVSAILYGANRREHCRIWAVRAPPFQSVIVEFVPKILHALLLVRAEGASSLEFSEQQRIVGRKFMLVDLEHVHTKQQTLRRRNDKEALRLRRLRQDSTLPLQSSDLLELALPPPTSVTFVSFDYLARNALSWIKSVSRRSWLQGRNRLTAVRSAVDLGQSAANWPSYGFIENCCNQKEGRMLAPPNSQKAWSPMEALSRWWRDWTGGSAASELRCCGEDEIARMAQDAGVSAAEFRKLSRLGPEGADLLLRRMEALDLDAKEVSQTERRTLQDLQRVCAMCESHRRCARDLAHDFGKSRLGRLLPERRNAQFTECDAVVITASVVNRPSADRYRGNVGS